jgi:hypothetical protein
MADEDLAPGGESEPDNAPDGEARQPEQNDTPEAVEPSPYDALAGEMGWVPKDQFRGNPDDWKPADEFIRAGRDIQRNLSRELKEVRGTLDKVGQTTEAILADKLAERDAYWASQRVEAIKDGDVEAVERIDQTRQQLRQQMPGVQPAPTPEGKSFADKHSNWFGKDTEATEYATKRCLHYAEMGLSHTRQLAAVEKDMKDLFPDLFPEQKPGRNAPMVNTSNSRSAGPSNRKKGFSDLTPAEQKVARDMAERGVIPDVDAYAKYAFKETVG